MNFEPDTHFIYNCHQNWTDDQGAKHTQRDKLLCKVTSVVGNQINWKTVDRIASIDKAPFDCGGVTAGAIHKNFVQRYVDRKVYEAL
jgi:hypothetical protein